MKYPECERCVQGVGPINLWANVALTIFKFVFGLMCGSIALIGDAIHSLGDVAMSIVMMLCLYFSGKEPDEDHPFGHGKIEFIGASVIGFGMLIVAVLIVWFAVRAVMSGALEAPDRIALLVAIISIAGNQLLHNYCLCAGQQVNSPVMIATAYENRSDVLSSMAALIGIGGAQMGWVLLDPLAAMVIGIIIFFWGFKTMKEAARCLGDFGLEAEVTREIRAVVENMDGVVGIDGIKARRVGKGYEVGLRVKVESTETVEWTNEVTQSIRGAVGHIVGNVQAVTVGFQGVEK